VVSARDPAAVNLSFQDHIRYFFIQVYAGNNLDEACVKNDRFFHNAFYVFRPTARRRSGRKWWVRLVAVRKYSETARFSLTEQHTKSCN
jgi:hypothetical protein